MLLTYDQWLVFYNQWVDQQTTHDRIQILVMLAVGVVAFICLQGIFRLCDRVADFIRARRKKARKKLKRAIKRAKLAKQSQKQSI